MPRRLAVAKHAGGFDAVGWTLLGFLLGASLAVFALLHADFHGMIAPFTTAPAPAPLASAPIPAPAPIVTYAAPSAPPDEPPHLFRQIAPAPTAPVASEPASPRINALATAGAASVHATARDARPKPPGAAPKARSEAQEVQVDEDAAAAGMTSRAGASPAQPAAAPARNGSSPELY